MFYLGMSGLVAAYVLIAALLLVFCLRSAWPWKVKGGLILLTTAFYLVTYFSWPQILGWPILDAPPHKFRLLAVHVEPPDRDSDTTGAIYLWLINIDDLASPLPPRAYRFAYSDVLYERVLQASSRLDKGIKQLGEIDSDPETNADKSGNMPGADGKSANIIFYDMPDYLFPDR